MVSGRLDMSKIFFSGVYFLNFQIGDPCCHIFAHRHFILIHLKVDFENFKNRLSDSNRAALRERLKHVPSRRPATRNFYYFSICQEISTRYECTLLKSMNFI